MNSIVVHERVTSVFAAVDQKLNVENVADSDSYQQESWLMGCGQSLTALGELGEKVRTYEDRVLYKVNKIWKTMRMDSLEKWNYDFYEWAREYLLNAGSDPIANPTIDNRVRIYKNYLSSESIIELPETVTITNTSSMGKPIIDEETGKISMVTVAPDLKDVKYSKMLTAAKTAKHGDMTPEAWNDLFDPTVTHRVFEKTIKNISSVEEPPPRPPKDYNFFMKNGVVYIVSANRTAPLLTIADLDDPETVDLMLVGLDVILTPIGIENPMSQGEHA